VRAHIDECIEAACLDAVEGQSDAKVAAALLTHREQRFRLSYVLGELITEENHQQDDFSFEPQGGTASALDEEDVVPEADRKRNGERIARYLERIKHLATEVAAETAKDFGPYAAQESPDDKSAWLELYSDRLFESEEFSKLALDIKGRHRKPVRLALDG
jgi:hypothetical protein